MTDNVKHHVVEGIVPGLVGYEQWGPVVSGGNVSEIQEKYPLLGNNDQFRGPDFLR